MGSCILTAKHLQRSYLLHVLSLLTLTWPSAHMFNMCKEQHCTVMCLGGMKADVVLLQDQQVAGAIETVLIPVTREGSLRPRTTLCVSSQVGCAMNCQFCFTGRMGLRYKPCPLRLPYCVSRILLYAWWSVLQCGHAKWPLMLLQ